MMLRRLDIKPVGIILFFAIISLPFTFSHAEEKITVTTYYPAPYGSYNQLTTTSNTYLATASGRVGIGTTNPGQKLTVAGMIETTSDGIKFPDGTIQTSALPSGMIAVFATSCPTGWTYFAALEGRFPRGSAAYTGILTSGSSTHQHAYSGTTDTNSASQSVDLGGARAANTHSHSYSGTTDEASSLPPYLDVVWCQKD